MSRDVQPGPMGEEDAWDTEITPRAGWHDFRLRELWRYRDLVLLFMRRDFVAQFKQTVLGPVWFIVQPLLTTLIFVLVFGRLARLGTDDLPRILFYLSGNILWMYFAGVVTATANTFATNAHLFGKVYFPRLAVPVSVTLSNLGKFGLQFLFFLCFLAYYLWSDAPVRVTAIALYFPLLLAIMAAMALGIGILVSALTTTYRDLRFLLDFGIRLAMYVTTVIYPLSSIPDRWKWCVLLNPMTPVIETFRAGFLGRGSHDPLHLAGSAAFATLVLLVGVAVFNRVERSFMDSV